MIEHKDLHPSQDQEMDDEYLTHNDDNDDNEEANDGTIESLIPKNKQTFIKFFIKFLKTRFDVFFYININDNNNNNKYCTLFDEC